ncbi:D-alanyl-D-alanine carboxypeptidase family protein [Methylocella tundrae]|nr:D-alanyl-D-alanine carboxypeptidase family protein [Methylocella tundrae]
MDLKIQGLAQSAGGRVRREKSGLRHSAAALILAALGCLAALRAVAAPSLLIELNSGDVLYQDHATQPWFPASLTKLMTVYVALKAVQDHRISLDTPLTVSARASAMPPSKMAFRPGTLVTLDTALKILMVKSANDVAVTVAEGVSGSVEAFAGEMNAAASSLGLQQSHFVNPNGLPDPNHYSSARDLAVLARALYLSFPEHADLFDIGALEMDGRVITNHNNLLGRYPGVDGMKTGFTCAAGFNVVASATQGGKKLIAVVLGAPNVALRTIKAAALFDRGFAGIDRPSGTLAGLSLQGGAPPDMGNAVCRNRGRAIAEFSAENEQLIAPLEAANSQAFASTQGSAFYSSSALSRMSPMATRITLVPAPTFEPVPIAIAGYAAPASVARGAPANTQTPPAVSAYAPAVSPALAATSAQLKPDDQALPMKGGAKPSRHARALAARHLAAAQAARRETHGKIAEASSKKTKTAHHGHAGAAQTADAVGDADAASAVKPGRAAKGRHGKDKAAHIKSAETPAPSGKTKAQGHLKQQPAKTSSAKANSAEAAPKAGQAGAKKAETSE